jgi:hypothetical protein
MGVKINKVIVSAAAAAEIKGAAIGTAPMLRSEAEYKALEEQLLAVKKLWADMAFEAGQKDRLLIALKARLGIPVELSADDTLREAERIASIVSAAKDVVEAYGEVSD